MEEAERSREVPIEERVTSAGEAPGTDVEPEGAAEAAEPADERDRVDADLRDLQERFLRLQAEFQNYRKREARERAASWSRAKGDLIQKTLGALDDLHRVATLDPDTTTARAVIDGVSLVERKLLEVLQAEGLSPIGETGEAFNPHVHEAIGMWPAPNAKLAGTIAAVPLRGYMLGDRLIRPAQVQVYEDRSPGSAPPPGSGEAAESEPPG